MDFELEKDMTGVITNRLYNITKDLKICNNKNQLIYSLEFPVYYRVIDVVLATYCIDYNDFEECQYYEKCIKKLPPRCMDILALVCSSKRISSQSIEKELFIPKDELYCYLNKLLDMNLIDKISKYSYKIGDWKELMPKRFIAIELKLSRWKEALDQGIYNQRFAEYSIVVLDESRIHMKGVIEKEYKDNNVGLIYLKKDGTYKIKVIPRKNKKINKFENLSHKLKVLKDFVLNEDKWKSLE